MATQAPQTFSELPLSEPILKAIAEAAYPRPTEVQAEVIPLVLAGIDLIVCSQTGTGKTTAYSIAINEMLDSSPGRIQALILAPTRELVIQVGQELERTGAKERSLTVVIAYGGAPLADQAKRMQTAEIAVATPGRMLELLRRKTVELSSLRMLVLDETDEMLSMGFEKEIEAILDSLPEDRHSLVFCATLSPGLKDLSERILSFPELVSFTKDATGAEQVEHYYCMISGVGRLRDLVRAIEQENPESALVFCNTREDSFHVANYLKRDGYSAEILNGDLPLSQREQLARQVKAGEARFLAATDVAARGLDLSFFPCVINYFLPESAESYIQRTAQIQRTGRKGVALSLISPREIGTFYQLRRTYKFDLVERALPSDEELIRIKERRALDQILEGLDQQPDLDYGRYLRFAEGFTELADWRTRLAKLMAYFVEKQAVGVMGSAPAQPATAQEVTGPPVQPDTPPLTGSPPPPPAERRPGARADRKGARRPREASRGEGARSSPPDPQGRERRRPPPPAPSAGDQPQEARVVSTRTVPAFRWIRINLAREQVDGPEQLKQLVADLSGMEVSDFGEAQIFDEYVQLEVRIDFLEDIIGAINGQAIGEHRLYARR